MSAGTNISVGGGMGLFGWLLILGLLGIGPCTNCMSGCGPTIDVPKLVQQAEKN